MLIILLLSIYLPIFVVPFKYYRTSEIQRNSLRLFNNPIIRSINNLRSISNDESIPSYYEFENQVILEKFKNKDILIIGDGDFSFANALSNMNITSSITATTKDSQNHLYKSFTNAKRNVELIIENGNHVLYNIDATNITILQLYDVIIWNFPHIVGKQNIKYNRLLLRSFLNSAGHNRNHLLKANGSILISLCENQSGTKSKNQDEWNNSWKLSEQVAEANMILLNEEPFEPSIFPGYIPMGHRGHGGSFLTGQSYIYTFISYQTNQNNISISSSSSTSSSSSSSSSNGYQAPLYVHEVHVVEDQSINDIDIFEKHINEKVKSMLKTLWNDKLVPIENPIWSIDIVDLYKCPKRNKSIYTIQITYCSLNFPLNRETADLYRSYVEKLLPNMLNMSARDEKHGGRVSKPYGWHVAQALLAIKNKTNINSFISNIDDLLHNISMNLEHINNYENEYNRRSSSNSIQSSNLDEINHTRRIATKLWHKRVGILLRGIHTVPILTLSNNITDHIEYITSGIHTVKVVS